MSPEVFQIIKSMSMKSLEIQIAVQCAPFLTGIKMSNLLIVQKDDTQYVTDMFQDSEISCFILCETNGKSTFLLYRWQELANYMNGKEVKQLLAALGHKNQSLMERLNSFRIRYEAYMNYGGEFPHEIGLLLGYPVEDVNGFIVNKGRNFLYAGYWKVYENLLEKQKIFEMYSQARETVIRLVSNGVSILEIVEMHSKNKLQKVAY